MCELCIPFKLIRAIPAAPSRQGKISPNRLISFYGLLNFVMKSNTRTTVVCRIAHYLVKIPSYLRMLTTSTSQHVPSGKLLLPLVSSKASLLIYAWWWKRAKQVNVVECEITAGNYTFNVVNELEVYSYHQKLSQPRDQTKNFPS